MSDQLYPHLAIGAARLADADEITRIRHIQRDRFIAHHAVTVVLNKLQDFVDRPASIRPPCMALVGDAGAGKSTLLNEFVTNAQNNGPLRHAIYCVADPWPSIPVMQTALLTALSIPTPMSARRYRAVSDDMIGRAIAEGGVRVVIIDEIQHVLNLPFRERVALWDWVKWISTACRVSVVCAGIPGSEEIVLKERQLATRFSVMRLPRWSAGAALGQFLDAFEKSLPLRRPSHLAKRELQDVLLRETLAKQQISGVTHGVKQIIEAAAIQAIRSGEERITPAILSSWREG